MAQDPSLDPPAGCTEPAKVYPDPHEADCWIVEAPTAAIEPRVFAGPNAEAAALEFAHRNYGSARFFTR
jgi:hypothetical protein